MWRSVISDKSTEINAPPQVFLSLKEANGPELWKTSRFVCCQIIKWHFAARALLFFVLFYSSFLRYKYHVWKTPDTKVVSYIWPSCISPPKMIATLYRPWQFHGIYGFLNLFAHQSKYYQYIFFLPHNFHKIDITMCCPSKAFHYQ